MDASKRKTKKTRANNNSNMDSTTKEFLQKICYKGTASVDMTKYGFIKDSKVYSMIICIRPLLQQLQKICGTSESNIQAKQISKRVRLSVSDESSRKCRKINTMKNDLRRKMLRKK